MHDVKGVCAMLEGDVCVCVCVFETYERVIWLIADPVTDVFFVVVVSVWRLFIPTFVPAKQRDSIIKTTEVFLKVIQLFVTISWRAQIRSYTFMQ